ncbi:MAG: phosphotransferase family protein, partial [Acidimicrobiales bacterium]
LGALADWLAPRLGDRPVLEARGRPGSGYSAENLIVSATVGATDRRLVLRRETRDAPIYPEQAPGLSTGVALQHRAMRSVADTVPVAGIIGFESDRSVLGVPFFVMDHVDGDVPVENPSYASAGFFADAGPEARRAVVGNGLAVLARLHTVPWADTDLVVLDAPGTTPGEARQLEVWETSLRQALRGRRGELLDDALVWLHGRLPPDPGPDAVVLSWGDARLGNMIWRDSACVCVTDFEGVALGTRELDVGWWLMCDRWMHEGSGAARLDGEPTRPEQRRLYAEAAGVRLGDTQWCEVFSAVRFATTVVHVMNRWEAHGLVAADHLIWRDNPATEVLGMLMDEATA